MAKRWANYYTQEKPLDAIGSPPQALVDAVDQMRAELASPATARRRVRHGQEFGDELDSDLCTRLAFEADAAKLRKAAGLFAAVV